MESTGKYYNTEVLRLLDHDYTVHVLRILVESQQYGNEFKVICAMCGKRDDQATSVAIYALTYTSRL